MESLIFNSISNPINVFKSFNIDNICNFVEIFFSQDFIKKKNKKKLIWNFNYNIMILICQTWMKFFENKLYIEKEIMNNFAIKIIIDEVYYVKINCWARLWWKILYIYIYIYIYMVLYICLLYTQLYSVCILIKV